MRKPAGPSHPSHPPHPPTRQNVSTPLPSPAPTPPHAPTPIRSLKYHMLCGSVLLSHPREYDSVESMLLEVCVVCVWGGGGGGGVRGGGGAQGAKAR